MTNIAYICTYWGPLVLYVLRKQEQSVLLAFAQVHKFDLLGHKPGGLRRAETCMKRLSVAILTFY